MPHAVEAANPGIVRVLDEEGRVVGSVPKIPKKDLLRLYEALVRLRLLDERMMNLQRQGRIGFYGASTGQEAAVVGSGAALGPDDWVFPALREGGVLLLRGFPLVRYVSMVFGNALDPSKGRQMPCHYIDRSLRQVSWSSCVGTQLPHAVGMAWAARHRKDPIVTMAYLGDGATSEGDFHTAANFAGVFRTPTVFFCQNNQWAISVPFSRQTASASIAVKASAYGFPGVRVDGNDCLAVHQVTGEAVERARGGEGPTLIEAVTYRMGAHSSSDDPRLYRDEAEVTAWAARDPIRRMRSYLEGAGFWNAAEDDQLHSRLSDEIAAAIQEAEKVPLPPNDTLFQDVFRETPWHLREQEAEFRGSAP